MSETGEKEFPADGGSYTAQMYSWSNGEEWAVTDDQNNELPEWVHVSYVDQYEDSEYNHLTDVKRMYPGAEEFFVITQGTQATAGDVNGDGDVNVSDVTALVNQIVN